MRRTAVLLFFTLLFLMSCQPEIEMKAILSVSGESVKVGETIEITLDYTPRIGDARGVIKIDGSEVFSSSEFPVVYTWIPNSEDVGIHDISGDVVTMFGEVLNAGTSTIRVCDPTPPDFKVQIIPSFGNMDDRILVPAYKPIKLFLNMKDPESKMFDVDWIFDDGEGGSLSGLGNFEILNLGVFSETGVRYLKLTVTNDEGLSSSTTLTLDVLDDTSAPRISLNSPSVIDKNKPLVVSLDVQDDTGLKEFWVKIDGSEVFREKVEGNAILGYSVNLGVQREGVHVISAYTVDLVGKVAWDSKEIEIGDSPIGLRLTLSDPGPDGIYSPGEVVNIGVRYDAATSVDVDIFVDGELIGKGLATSWVARSGLHTVSALATMSNFFEWCHKTIRVEDNKPPELDEVQLNGVPIDPSSAIVLSADANVLDLVFSDESGFTGGEKLIVYLSEEPMRGNLVDVLSLSPVWLSNDGKREKFRLGYDFKDLSGKTIYVSVSGVSDVIGNTLNPPVDILLLKIGGG